MFFQQQQPSATSFSNFNFDFILKNPKLDDATRHHLAKVYGMLACTVVAAFVGSVIDFIYHLGGILAGIGYIGAVFYIIFTRPTPENSKKRQAALMSVGFLTGLISGPLIRYAVRIDGGAIVMNALLASICVFVALSIAAMVCQHSHIMILVGLASAIGMFLMMTRIMMMFSMRSGLYDMHLYAGLVMFAMYVVIDTAGIIARSQAGDKDVVSHSLMLFTDFVQLFYRILIIMMQQKQKEEEKRRRRRD